MTSNELSWPSRSSSSQVVSTTVTEVDTGFNTSQANYNYKSNTLPPEDSSPSRQVYDLSVGSPDIENSDQSAESKDDISVHICEVPYLKASHKSQPPLQDPNVSTPSYSPPTPPSLPSPPPPPPPYSPPVLNLYSMSMQQSQYPAGASIITQVSADPQGGLLDTGFTQSGSFGNNIRLDLRGTVIELTRPELSQLPESILLGISNGLCTDNLGNIMFSMGDAEVAAVNFSPECLQYTLDIFREASKEISQTHSPIQSEPNTPTSEHAGSVTEDRAESISELLRTKPAIIVLREDLDYYCLPPDPSISTEEMISIKKECGKRLVEHNRIFPGLQRGENPGSAEQHLIDMLCSSGFSIDERWGFRALEPSKTVVSSLALVRLRPIVEESSQETIHSPNHISESQEPSMTSTVLPTKNTDSNPESNHGTIPTATESSVSADSATLQELESSVQENAQTSNTLSQSSSSSTSSSAESSELGDISEGSQGEVVQPETDMARSHKLLLFWRKPARKCWWDSVILNDIPNVKGSVKIHIRSVWTLELSVIEH